MDPVIAQRLESEEEFEKKLSQLVREYVKLGREAVTYWEADFDVAYDIMMCYAPLEKEDYTKLSKGHPKRFILPMSATQIETMTTYIAQVLFGQETPHKVEPRGPEDEIAAEYMNQLLRWNAEQQPTYSLGYLWVRNSLIANRGVFYNYWAPLYGHSVEMVEQDNPVTGERYWRPKRTSKVIGGYVKYDLISPYDFFCDPTLPLWRLQEGRFAGHRTTVQYTELVRRSKLKPTDPQYVLPSAVQKIKDRKKNAGQSSLLTSSTIGSQPAPGASNKLSYTAYERGRAATPTGQETANKGDIGPVELTEISVRLIPADYDIFPETDTNPVVMQFLLAGDDIICSVNESTYAHGEYPYTVGEARPSGLSQFSPSWLMMLKGIQDYVDWLKNRHQEALSRTIGNVFIYDPAKVDVEDFLNPEKEGLLIPLRENIGSTKISDVIQQVSIKDMTENFHVEMVEFARMSENITGANSYMQGQTSGDASATEFAGTQQMSAGRMSSVARLLSTQALVGQTRQVVSNFQQFLEVPQAIRFSPSESSPDVLLQIVSLVLNRDLIQGQFDFIPHDGTLPGTDGRKVAAISRLLEAAAAFPDVFAPAPGNLNPRRLIYEAAKASGVKIENFKWRPQDIPQQPPAAGPEAGAGGPPQLEQGPIQAPGPAPADPSLGSAGPAPLPSAEPPAVRPGNQ